MTFIDPNLDDALNVAIETRRTRDREDALDEPADRLRDLLENKYRHYLPPSDIAPETEKQYLDEFRKFAAWCRDNGPCPSLPARDVFIAAYLDELLEGGATYSKLKIIAAAIARAHDVKRGSSGLVQGILKKARMNSVPASTRKKRTKKMADNTGGTSRGKVGAYDFPPQVTRKTGQGKTRNGDVCKVRDGAVPESTDGASKLSKE